MKNSYEIYKFKPGDIAYCVSFIGAEEGFKIKIFTAYTSDKYNHPALPHRRYVCTLMVKDNFQLLDLAEVELITQEEYLKHKETL